MTQWSEAAPRFAWTGRIWSCPFRSAFCRWGSCSRSSSVFSYGDHSFSGSIILRVYGFVNLTK
nr:MAG TPA: hypothetical protein [Caudoviricetes sp.]